MGDIYKLLELNRKSSLAIFDSLLRVKGLNCEVYRPMRESQSIFGKEDLINYDEGAVERHRLLIFNLFGHQANQRVGIGEFDPFYPQNTVFALTKCGDEFPIQTRIVIDFYGKKIAMKVDDHEALSPSVVDSIFVKNMLVAST